MKNPFRRGVVTFVFDDGYQRVYENALPILDSHKMPGVFALPLDGQRLERSEHRRVKYPQPVRRWQDWKHIEAAGHEIAAHSATHPDLRHVTASQLEHELREPKELLGATSFVYPGGAHNAQIVSQTMQYYAAARTVLRGFESLPPKDPYRLRTFNFSRNNFSVWKANLFVLWAWITNAWIIETYHMVDDNTSRMVHTVPRRGFESHVQFVSLLPIEVKTIKQVMSG